MAKWQRCHGQDGTNAKTMQDGKMAKKQVGLYSLDMQPNTWPRLPGPRLQTWQGQDGKMAKWQRCQGKDGKMAKMARCKVKQSTCQREIFSITNMTYATKPIPSREWYTYTNDRTFPVLDHGLIEGTSLQNEGLSVCGVFWRLPRFALILVQLHILVLDVFPPFRDVHGVLKI